MREADRPLEHLPLSAFLVLYAVSFLLGAALLLVGAPFFVRHFARTVGIKPFWLEAPEVLANWLLVVGAPALFAAGWLGASRKIRDASGAAAAPAAPSLPLAPVLACYGAAGALAMFSLARSGALLRAGAWLDYGALIQARFLLFDRLSFAEWTNLYILLPTLSGLLAVRVWQESRSSTRRRLAVTAIVAFLIGVELLGFQKRYVVLSLIYLAACAAVNSPGLLARGRRGFMRIAAVGGVAYVSYCALLVAPQLQITTAVATSPRIQHGDTTGLLRSPQIASADGTANTAPLPSPGTPPSVLPTRSRTYYTEIRRPALKAAVGHIFPARWIGTLDTGAPGGQDSFVGRLAFALLAPATRTPPPALAYPALFPKVLPYFGLDVAGDILGIGRMPDDNLIVYGAMYGQLEKGATSVPFQYSWFSQIGLFGSLLLCALLGSACAVLWRRVLGGSSPPEVRAAMGALVVLFCVEISQDSCRGSLLNAYGVAWGALVVLTIGTISRPRTAQLQPGPL